MKLKRLLLALAVGGLVGCGVPGADGNCAPGLLCLGLQHVEDSGAPTSPASPLLGNPGFIDPRGGWSLASGNEVWIEDLREERIVAGGQFWYHQGNNHWVSADGDLAFEFETQRTGLFWGQNEASPIRMTLFSR